MAKKTARKKTEKTDGLGPHEIKKIRNALRAVWRYSHARTLVVKRCLGKGGYSHCEKCKKRAPKVFIDHIATCGAVDEGYIERLFCPSSALQGLCKMCHGIKTKEDNKKTKAGKDLYDFF